MNNPLPFIREKFDILLVAALFVFVFLFYVRYANTDAAAYLKDASQGLLYALLALVGVRARAGSQINADIDTANIQTTDRPPAGNQTTGETENENQTIRD